MPPGGGGGGGPPKPRGPWLKPCGGPLFWGPLFQPPMPGGGPPPPPRWLLGPLFQLGPGPPGPPGPPQLLGGPWLAQGGGACCPIGLLLGRRSLFQPPRSGPPRSDPPRSDPPRSSRRRSCPPRSSLRSSRRPMSPTPLCTPGGPGGPWPSKLLPGPISACGGWSNLLTLPPPIEGRPPPLPLEGGGGGGPSPNSAIKDMYSRSILLAFGFSKGAAPGRRPLQSEAMWPAPPQVVHMMLFVTLSLSWHCQDL